MNSLSLSPSFSFSLSLSVSPSLLYSTLTDKTEKPSLCLSHLLPSLAIIFPSHFRVESYGSTVNSFYVLKQWQTRQKERNWILILVAVFSSHWNTRVYVHFLPTTPAEAGF
jgi:hypothetical protein